MPGEFCRMKSIQMAQVQSGVCYYPEQWPDTFWEDDFRRMRELGFSVIRIAEFAWSIFEPTEGVFCFDFFERVMDLAHRFHLRVILGTPTATPPAWLTTPTPRRRRALGAAAWRVWAGYHRASLGRCPFGSIAVSQKCIKPYRRVV